MELQWEIVELMGHQYYAQKGYRVLVPLISSHGYDFVAEKDGKFIRINVKLAGKKSRTIENSWSISIASGAGVKNKDAVVCDTFLVMLPHQNRFIELPGNFFVGSKSKSKLIPRNLL